MKAHIPHKGAALPRKANPLPLRKTGGICGSGLELDAIFQRFPELEVTGIDLSAEMLARLAQKHGEKSLRLIQGDYFQQELGTGRYSPGTVCAF